MARRARNPKPFSIKLAYNMQTGYYESTEGGITYQLTYSQMNEMKKSFFSGSAFTATLTQWYNSLPGLERNKVKRIGAPEQPTDFYPDPEY